MNLKTCPTCHAPIPENAPGGLCPACVLRDAEEGPAPGHGVPPIEEIAAAFPQWEILGLIGRGGMGFVYKVRQPALDRTVALKILDPALGHDPAFAERFAREARTLGKLQHPNIVTVFEHGEAGGFFYLVMEHIDGVNLRQAMQAGRFTPEQALAIVPGICDALQAAHAQGVWHRDIKPENILLDRDGRVKIADFGIARLVGDPQRDFTLTRTGHALGSAAYMAPEQFEKPHHVDHRADIYSLGVVIYEMLTGELPLGRFPLPSQRAEVGKRIDEIVLRTLEKERELRQQSAMEVKTDVESAASAPAPERTKSSPEPSSPLTRLPRLVLWSLGLLIGGGALMGAAAWVADSFRDRHITSMMTLLIAVGGAVSAAGVVGALWALYEMKRGWITPVGRWLLIGLTLAPAACAAIGIAWAYIFTTTELHNHKGELQLMMGSTYGALALAFGILFHLARPLHPATSKRRRLGRIAFVLAAITSIGGAVLVKRFDYHWPHLFYGERATLKLLNPDRPSDEQVLALLKKAAGPFVDDYELSVENGVATVTAVTRELWSPVSRLDPETNHWMTRLDSHSNNTLHRLMDLLPAGVSTPRQFDPFDPSGSLRPEWIRQSDPRYLRQHATIAVLAILGALLAALAGGRRAGWLVGGVMVLHCLMFALPVWPVSDAAPPRVLDAPPLPPTVLRLPSDRGRLEMETHRTWTLTPTSTSPAGCSFHARVARTCRLLSNVSFSRPGGLRRN